MNALGRWLFARETSGTNTAFKNVVDLIGARAPKYSDGALVQCHHYEYIVAKRLKIAIGTKDIRVLKREQTIAAREYLGMSRLLPALLWMPLLVI